MGKRCEIAIIYVFTDEQARAVALDDGLVDALEPGSVLVVQTTGSPETAKAIAAAANGRGVGVVDAAASGGPADLAAGRLNIFAGGDVEDIARCRPVFEAYASAITHFGPVGAGQMVKLVNNLLFGCHIELALEAARLVAAFGVDEVEFAHALHACSGQSYSLDLVESMGGSQKLVTAAGKYVHKDAVVARAVAAEAGVDLGSFGAVVDALIDRTAL